MPKIPQNTGETVDINPGQTPRMGYGAIGATEQAVEGVVKGIQGAEEAVVKANQTMQRIGALRQKNEAKAAFSDYASKIRSASLTDQDLDINPYEKKLKEGIESFSQSIQDPLTKAEFKEWSTNHAITTRWQISDSFRTKQIAGLKDSIAYSQKNLVQNAGDMDPIMLQKSINDFNVTLDEAKSIGAITDGDYKLHQMELQSGIHESIAKSAIANDMSIETKSSPVLKELENPNGRFIGLSSVQREQLIKAARQHINDNKQEGVERKVDNTFKILNQLANGEINWQNSSDLIKEIGPSNPALAEAMQRVVTYGGAPITGIDDMAYSDMVKGVFSSNSKAQIANFLLETLNDNPNKEISKSKLSLIVWAATERAKNLPTGNDANQYNTVLTEQEEKRFRSWKQKYAPNDSGLDYDLRGAFKDGLKPGENGHFPDKYKKPWHPTFSDQSIYATDENKPYAGTWEGDKYIAPKEKYPEPKEQYISPIQAKIDAGIHSISISSFITDKVSAFFNYLQAIKDGENPEKAQQSAVAADMIRNNPMLVGFPMGRTGVDVKTGIKYKYYPDGRREKID